MDYPSIKTNKRRIRSATFTLRLTSMIDMMTILLVFLLKSYDAEGQIVTITDDLRLPESTSQLLPKVTSVIAITSDWILLDGRPVATLETVRADEQMLIPSLQQELDNLRQVTEGIGEMSDSRDGFQGNISIQSDREVTFDLFKKILITCSKVGYNNMLLTVMQKE